MLLTQRSPFSSPTGSGCSSPFGSPCHSDYSSPRGQMALPAARISPRVQQSSGHQHRSTGHFGGGGAESPPALMSPLRHSKSLPADMHIAGQDEPSAHRQQCQQSQQQMGSMDPAPICRASSLQPPPRRLSKRPSLQLLRLDSQELNFQYNLTRVLDHLYIGSEEIPSQTSLLRSQNITHIVNASCHTYYEQPEQGRYVRLDLRDEVEEQIGPKLGQAFALIEDARQSGSACIVHCRHGMSRSAAVAIAYLMRFRRMPLIEAFKYVRDRRPCISPNPGFMRQLADMERELFGCTTVDVQRYEDDRFGDIHNLALPRPGGAAQQRVQEARGAAAEDEGLL